MTGFNENAAIAESLATTGIEGTGEKACSYCGCKHFRVTEVALRLALCSIEAAQGHLDVYACHTDEPVPGVVDAADLLELVRAALHAAATIEGSFRLSARGQNGCLEAT